MNNLFETTYDRNGSSVTTNNLGMREMQLRAYEKYASQYLLLKAPPASGKSRALMFIAIEKLKQGLVKKVIVAVPERSIGKSFGSTRLMDNGFHTDWVINQKYDLCISILHKSGKCFCLHWFSTWRAKIVLLSLLSFL